MIDDLFETFVDIFKSFDAFSFYLKIKVDLILDFNLIS